MNLLQRILSVFRRQRPPPRAAMPPALRAIAVVVPGVAGAAVTLDARPPFTGVTNADGYYCWLEVPVNLAATTLSITVPGYEPYALHVDLPADGRNYTLMVTGTPATGAGQIVCPALVPTTMSLPALVIRGSVFGLASGDRWTAIECTDFQLYQRFLRGEDLAPVLAQRAALGFNLVRVALTCHQMFALHPGEYSNYFDRLVPFVRRLAREGLRPEFVVFMDAGLVMPVMADQVAFVAVVLMALQEVADQILVELVNENDQRVNMIDAASFQQPAGFLAAHGSNGSQAVPVRPPWSYETFHTNDAPEWPRKVGHNAMELSEGGPGFDGSHVPVLANENTRCPDRFNATTQAFDAAAAAALLCAGSCFHAVHGKSSELFEDVELACARAWVAGARSVPLEFQAGLYCHRTDLETPDVLRAYGRVLPDGRSFAVTIRR